MNEHTESIHNLLNRVRTCQLSIHFQYQTMSNGFEQFMAEFDQDGNV